MLFFNCLLWQAGSKITVLALERLVQRYGGSRGKVPGWQPLDWEKPLADYSPTTEMPDPSEVIRTVNSSGRKLLTAFDPTKSRSAV